MLFISYFWACYNELNNELGPSASKLFLLDSLVEILTKKNALEHSNCKKLTAIKTVTAQMTIEYIVFRMISINLRTQRYSERNEMVGYELS